MRSVGPRCRVAAGGDQASLKEWATSVVPTVEGHLTQTYMKLDITSRDQLASALDSPAVCA